MKNPLVSVILPVYNREKLVSRCMDSLIEQEYRNIEMLCVDDASTDDTLSVLLQYANNDSRVKVFHHEVNRNAGGARNTAIQNAKGEYLYFVDSDDWVDSCAISDLMDASQDGYYDIVSAPLTIHETGCSPYIEEHADSSLSLNEIYVYGMTNGMRIVGGYVKDIYSRIKI